MAKAMNSGINVDLTTDMCTRQESVDGTGVFLPSALNCCEKQYKKMAETSDRMAGQ